MDEITQKQTSITDFYANKSIFVTGATGFIGKVLLEKLLYTCLDIDKIYILLRGNEKATSEQRLKEIIEKQVFKRIREAGPQFLDKIVAVPGDIAENNLGINSKNEQSLIDDVSVVFHSAATVRFNNKLDISLNLNYEATKRVLRLCHRMKNLKSFVYMSTAFINPQNKYLDEVIYPAPVDPQVLLAFIEQKKMDDEEELTKILNGRPNTYTFTKALAENYVAENHGAIPTAIIRPSIVTAAATEPFPGWIDSWSVAAASVTTTGLGYNRVVVGKWTNIIDLIPVDYVTNLAIVAAAKNRPNKLEIFNSCTSACNPVSLHELYKITGVYSAKQGYNEVPVPFAIIMNDGKKKEMTAFILEKLPAMIADLFMRWKGKKPRYVNLQSKVATHRELIKFFTSHTFAMSADKTIALSRSLSKKDAHLFPFNPEALNWKQYLPGYVQGIRKYLMKK